MALDVYFRDDVVQGIVAVTVGMLSASAANGAGNVEYCRGVVDMARAMGLDFGIRWPALAGELHEALRKGGQENVLELVTTGLIAG